MYLHLQKPVDVLWRALQENTELWNQVIISPNWLSVFWKFIAHFTLFARFCFTANSWERGEVSSNTSSAVRGNYCSYIALMHVRSWKPGRERAACGTQIRWKDNAAGVCMWERCCTLSRGLSVSTTTNDGSGAGYHVCSRSWHGTVACWEVERPSQPQHAAAAPWSTVSKSVHLKRQKNLKEDRI